MQYKIPPKVLEIKYSQSQIFSLHFSIIRNNFAIMTVKERFISVKASGTLNKLSETCKEVCGTLKVKSETCKVMSETYKVVSETCKVVSETCKVMSETCKEVSGTYKVMSGTCKEVLKLIIF